MRNIFKFIVIVFILAITFSVQGQKIINVPEEYKSISQALINCKRGDTILVAPGIYKEQFTIPSGVSLIATKKYKAIIDGRGRGNTINMSNNSSINGFDITNGTSGIVTKSPGIVISNCRIYKNSGSAILSTGNLPEIKNCLIVFNQGSGIQAVNISGGSITIERNTIAYNLNTGISVSGKVGITIKNNIISNNTSQGIKLNGLSQKLSKINNNVFHKNHRSKIAFNSSNVQSDPLFKDPKRKEMDFSLQQNSPAKGRANDGSDPGFVM